MGPRDRGTKDSSHLASHAPLILLCVAAFLAPLIGGTISVDAMPLEPGYAPLMKSIFGGTETPLLSHFVLVLLACASAIWTLVSRRVVQAPMMYFGIACLVFFGLAATSVIFSGYRFASIPVALEWTSYAIALFSVVAAVGRKSGPIVLAGSLFAGCVVLGLLAIWEYAFLSNDPSWRVFGTWQNPNALAGMLLLGLFLGFGLTMRLSALSSFAAGAGTAAIGLAIALTQSKGAYLSAFVGIVALLLLTLAWVRPFKNSLLQLARAAVCVIALIGLLFAIRARQAPDGGSAPAALGRIADAGATQEQSAGFRTLLWKGAAELIREKPLGWGIGAYRYESARPGLTTQTHLAHNSFLQLGAEAGLLAPIFLLAMGAVWFFYAFKGARSQPADGLVLKAGVVAAIVAAAAHNMVDSDLYFYGSGLAFFMLLGLGMQLNTDGVTPESVQPGPRWTAFAVSLFVPVALLYFGAIEATKAHLRLHLAKGEIEPARAGAETLASLASRDGDAWFLTAGIAETAEERLGRLKKAVEATPTNRNMRALAREQMQAGDVVGAGATLNLALMRDPNNLYTLKLLMDLHIQAENHELAQTTAERLIEVEETSYFKVRSLPELVPTETYYARRYLAQRTENLPRKAELLGPALDGFSEYATVTVPNVVRHTAAGLPGGFAGESREDALEKMKSGKDVAEDLRRIYERLGRSREAGVATDKIGLFDTARASLESAASLSSGTP